MLDMKTKALFLDRDGVVNVDKNYVYKEQDFEFCEGIFALCQLFLSKGFKIFIITNQSGIARGFYSEKDFEQLSEFMCKGFEKQGINITKIYYCPHLEKCECRKPKPGMLLQAQNEFDIDLTNSVFIGDNVTDMEAGKNAGVKTLCLVGNACGHSQKGDQICEFYEKFANLNEITHFFEDKL